MTTEPRSEAPPSTPAPGRQTIAEGAARAALERVLESAAFSRSARSCACLRVIVEQSLSPRDYPLKEREIARAVLGADRSFDPVTNPSVRVQVSRMRARLARYYEGPGATDPIRIVVPVGRYTAEFLETTPAGPPIGSPTTTAVRIAVLKLADEEVAVATGSGLAERIVTDLSRFPGCEVIGPVGRGDDDPDPRVLAERLEAHLVLDGSVRQDSARMRVTARLIDGTTGVVIWSRTYDEVGTGADFFDTTAGVSGRVAAAIADYQGAAMRSPLVKADRPGDPVVFEALRRYYSWSDGLDFERYGEVVDALEQAHRLEPRNTLVMALLAASLHLGPEGHNDDPSGRGFPLAQRAHELDPTMALPLLVFAVHEVHVEDLDAAAMWARRAAQLSPNHPTVLYTAGGILISADQWREGLELVEQAMDLTPNHPDYWFGLHAVDAVRTHDWDRALTLGRRVGHSAPPWGSLVRAAALAGLGRTKEMQQEFSVLRAHLPGFDADGRAAVAGLQDIPLGWVPWFMDPIEGALAEGADPALDVPAG